MNLHFKTNKTPTTQSNKTPHKQPEKTNQQKEIKLNPQTTKSTKQNQNLVSPSPKQKSPKKPNTQNNLKIGREWAETKGLSLWG